MIFIETKIEKIINNSYLIFLIFLSASFFFSINNDYGGYPFLEKYSLYSLDINNNINNISNLSEKYKLDNFSKLLFSLVLPIIIIFTSIQMYIVFRVYHEKNYSSIYFNINIKNYNYNLSNKGLFGTIISFIFVCDLYMGIFLSNIFSNDFFLIQLLISTRIGNLLIFISMCYLIPIFLSRIIFELLARIKNKTNITKFRSKK